MELTKEVLQELAKPFPPSAISIKVQTKPNENMKSLCVAYIDARDVMNRLDEVVGGEWSDAYQKAPSGGLECGLTVCGVTRHDVGEDDGDNEKEKAGYSDAFKRAAVKFGIGRFLYSLPKMYATVKQVGKNAYLADGEEKRLQGVISAALAGSYKPEPKKEVISVDVVNQDLVIESAQPAPQKKTEFNLKPNEVISDSEWDTFSILVTNATTSGVKLPEYRREKMTASTLNGATKYIIGKLDTTYGSHMPDPRTGDGENR